MIDPITAALRCQGKTNTFAMMYGETPKSLEQERMEARFPKQGKFLAIYKDKDDEPQQVGFRDVKVLPHTVCQFAWVDGVLYEHDEDRAEWDKTTLENEARYLVREAIPSSVTFLTMGDTVVFEEKTTVVERKG